MPCQRAVRVQSLLRIERPSYVPDASITRVSQGVNVPCSATSIHVSLYHFIALCGYAGEGHEALEAAGWTVEEWKATGGYGSRGEGRGRENAAKERIWFSPNCLKPVKAQQSIFDYLGSLDEESEDPHA